MALTSASRFEARFRATAVRHASVGTGFRAAASTDGPGRRGWERLCQPSRLFFHHCMGKATSSLCATRVREDIAFRTSVIGTYRPCWTTGVMLSISPAASGSR
jgi:hypothetical protein